MGLKRYSTQESLTSGGMSIVKSPPLCLGRKRRTRDDSISILKCSLASVHTQRGYQGILVSKQR